MPARKNLQHAKKKRQPANMTAGIAKTIQTIARLACTSHDFLQGCIYAALYWQPFFVRVQNLLLIAAVHIMLSSHPSWLTSNWLQIVRNFIEQLRPVISVANYLEQKSLAAVADTEPNFNNAAVKQTLQVDVRADFKNLLAARRYSADRSDCDN